MLYRGRAALLFAFIFAIELGQHPDNAPCAHKKHQKHDRPTAPDAPSIDTSLIDVRPSGVENKRALQRVVILSSPLMPSANCLDI
jgi:hypothetical protein